MVFSSAPAQHYRPNDPLSGGWENPQSTRLIMCEALLLRESLPTRYCGWPRYSGPPHRALGQV